MTLETLIVVSGFPFLAPLIVSAIFWKKLERKWLFLITSFLSMTALADLSLSFFSAWLMPSAIPAPNDLLGFSIRSARQTHVALLLTDAAILLIGMPLLGWLFAALRGPSGVVAPVEAASI